MLKRLLIILPFLLITAAVVFAALQYQRWQQAPLPIEEAHVLQIPAGEPLGRLAQRLAAQGVIENEWDLKLLARVRGDAGRIRAGEYELQPGLTLAGLLDQMIMGRVKLHALTVIEGMTVLELLDALQLHPAIKMTLETRDPEAIASALDLPTSHSEGWFLPETYRFPRGTTDVEFLKRAHAAMRRELDEAWDNRQPDLPLKSPYEALILASIIEKETSLESERRTIAGVFIRRLQRGMRLQTDPTVIYGVGESYAGDIRRRHLQEDTPYNTYTRSGLPPTPIALPSRASLRAAVNPEPGDALYFVAIEPRGAHKFSATYEEHREAVRKYQMVRRPIEKPTTPDNGEQQ